MKICDLYCIIKNVLGQGKRVSFAPEEEKTSASQEVTPEDIVILADEKPGSLPSGNRMSTRKGSVAMSRSARRASAIANGEASARRHSIAKLEVFFLKYKLQTKPQSIFFVINICHLFFIFETLRLWFDKMCLETDDLPFLI